MTADLRLPCPICSGTRSTTTGDRHADTNMDVCATCHDEGTILARPGETPEASFGFVNRNATATDGKDFPKTGMSFLESENGARTALVGKIAAARRYADREGFEFSTLCLPREDTDALLAVLAPKPTVPGNDAAMREPAHYAYRAGAVWANENPIHADMPLQRTIAADRYIASLAPQTGSAGKDETKEGWEATLRYCEKQWSAERGAMFDRITALEAENNRLLGVPAGEDERGVREGDREREIEELAEHLHEEREYNGWTWPTHPDDDGYRGGGYVTITPPDVQALLREEAGRILIRVDQSRRRSLTTAPAADGEGSRAALAERGGLGAA